METREGGSSAAGLLGMLERDSDTNSDGNERLACDIAVN